MDIDMLFLGAGASTSFGVPTMKGMVTEFEKSLESGDDKQLYELVGHKLENYKYFDLESLITILQNILQPNQAINDVLTDPSIHLWADCESAKKQLDFLPELTRCRQNHYYMDLRNI